MTKKKICVITGATSGIGWSVAHQMADKNYSLIVVGRNEKKGKALKKSLLKETPDCDFQYFIADLSETEEVKSVAKKIAETTDKIDVLINNAGGVYSHFQTTENGIEKTIANNHLAYFTLTLSLLPQLKAAKESRIILVSSASHYKGSMKFESFTNKTNYRVLRAYAQSKLANIMFAYQLKERLKDENISTFVLHPGVVRTPIGTKNTTAFQQFVWKIFAYFRYNTTPEESAKTYVYLATEQEARAHNGLYFHQGLIKDSSEESYDVEKQMKLWRWSEKVTGVSM